MVYIEELQISDVCLEELQTSDVCSEELQISDGVYRGVTNQ